jgi:archaellum component FlaC
VTEPDSGARERETSDERSDLILNMLGAIRAEQAVQREKLDEIISRLGRLEREVADLHREVAGLHDDYAGLSVRLDNLDRRVGRIESRLELVDQPR